VIETTPELAEEVREGSPETAFPDAQPESAQRARSVTLPPLPSLTAVTERVRKAGAAVSKAGALLDKPGSLIHAQPPTFKQAKDRHHECAGHIRTWTILRVGRYAWGWFHLLVILPPLYLLAWVTESPLRLFIAAALAAAVLYWS